VVSPSPGKLLAFVLVIIALTACDRFSDVDRIGVKGGEDGSVQIVYLACDYERLTAVGLYDVHDPTTGEDDELLWEIRAQDGADGGAFTVGSQPEDWVETVAFEGQLGDTFATPTRPHSWPKACTHESSWRRLAIRRSR
jgi:hypothetical protein